MEWGKGSVPKRGERDDEPEFISVCWPKPTPLACENVSANNKEKTNDTHLLSPLIFLTLNKYQFSAGQKLSSTQHCIV